MARGLCVLVLATLGLPAAAQAAVPRVHLTVVGRSRVLLTPHTVGAPATTVAINGKRCAVGAATPLAALAAGRRAGGPSFSVRDYGACSSRPANSGSLFVFRVGADRNSGRNGWTYKVGTRSGSTGAADLTGPFGTGRRLHTNDRVTWFWCVLSRSGSCQRTLTVVPARKTVSGGARLAVRVLGYDDFGRSVRVAGATVRLGASSAVTGRDGIALVVAPKRVGRARVSATRRGMVAAFPEEVTVG